MGVGSQRRRDWVVRMHKESYADRSSLEATLRRRGHVIQRTGATDRIFFTEELGVEVLQSVGQFVYLDRIGEICPGADSAWDAYFHLMGKANVRKVLRSLCGSPGPVRSMEELRTVGGASVGTIIRDLCFLHIVEDVGGNYRLKRAIDNIGPSFEHYVANLCEFELYGSANWGISLDGLPRAGGDYDVLAWLAPSIVYIECKSARPTDISKGEIARMLQRSEELAPHCCILLVDTPNELDCIAARIDECFFDAKRRTSGITMSRQNAYQKVWHGFGRQYLIGSEPSIATQIRRCLQHYYARVNTASEYIPRPVPLESFTR